MIQQNESGLNPTQYAALLAAFEDPSVSVVLQQYSLSLTEQSAGGSGTTSSSSFDAIVCNDVVIRGWATGSGIVIETLTSEDAGDQTWSAQTLTASGIDIGAGVSFAVSGDTVRVFYYSGGWVRYFASTDKGVAWGTSVAVVQRGSIHKLAATALTRVHYIAKTAKNNYRFHVANYSASWSESNSQIYWPFEMTSFDAAPAPQADDGAASSPDILAFTTDFPPMVKISVENTEMVRNFERVRGIAIIRYQNGRWSEHRQFDVVDNLYASAERLQVRLAVNGDWLLMSYHRVDGIPNHIHEATAISRSKTGIHWEQPYLLSPSLVEPVMLVKRGDHAYLLNVIDTYRSPSVGYTDDPTVTQDLTDRVTSIAARMGDIQEVQITSANPTQALDATTPFGSDVSLQAVIEIGYVVDGETLRIQTGLIDIDALTGTQRFPTDHSVLVGRDLLARLLTVNADQVQEWNSQQVSGDNWKGTDETKYSGLHHTAPSEGRWETENLTLLLAASKHPGVAFHTGIQGAWNGECRAQLSTSVTDSDDYAGLCFRAYNKENMLYVIYNADDDLIKLVQRLENTDTTLETYGPMGWNRNSFYSISIRYRYGKVLVYTSDNTIDFTLRINYELAGVEAGAWDWGDFALQEGAQGYLGYGYSDTSQEWPDLPGSIPWPVPVYTPSEVDEWPDEMFLGTWEMGVYRTEDFTGPDGAQPTWEVYNAGLPQTMVLGNIHYQVRQLLLDPYDQTGRQYVLMGTENVGGAIYRRTPEGSPTTWEEVLNNNDGDTLTGLIGGNTQWIAVNPTRDGHLYALFGSDGIAHGELYMLKSTDYGETWAKGGEMWNDTFLYEFGTMVARGDTIYCSLNAGSGGSRGRLVISTDGGASFTDSPPTNMGVSQWTPQIGMSPLNAAKVYSNNFDPLHDYDIISWTSPAAVVVHQDSLNIGPMRTDAMWFSAVTEALQRVLMDNKIYATLNAWTGVKDSTPTPITTANIGAMRAPVEDNENMIVLGRTELVVELSPQHVMVMLGETNTSPVDKSGIDPENKLTTVSVPYTGDGICFEGLKPVTEDSV